MRCNTVCWDYGKWHKSQQNWHGPFLTKNENELACAQKLEQKFMA
jgi:hypothetical protein